MTCPTESLLSIRSSISTNRFDYPASEDTAWSRLPQLARRITCFQILRLLTASVTPAAAEHAHEHQNPQGNASRFRYRVEIDR